MSLLPHSFFPRSMFDMDQWSRGHHQGLSTLDLFDPFDELDHTIGRNLMWLNKPEFLSLAPLVPKVPHKYRITVDCAGYSPSCIQTEIQDKNKLIVHAREESKDGEDFSIKEFKKTYVLPENSETDKLVSFMATGGQLVIEVPLKEAANPNTDLFPQIVDNSDGSKSVSVRFVLPDNVDPSKAVLSVKDRDIIFKAEDVINKPDKVSKFYYYKRTTLPENTEFKQLKCVQDNNQITVTAPLDMTLRHHRIPIEHKLPIEHNTQQKAVAN